MKLLDIHTHCYDASSQAVQVLNLEASDWIARPYSEFEAYLAGFPEGVYFSVGIHPWKSALISEAAAPAVSAAATPAVLQPVWHEKLAILLRHPRVVLLGEIGLDKCCDVSFEAQITVFEQQLAIAAELQKPVILHIVKAMDTLLALRKKYLNIPTWIIHGFRGNAHQAQQYLQHGFLLSFGPRHQIAALQIVAQQASSQQASSLQASSQQVAALQASPLEKLLLETDNDSRSVKQSINNVYEQVARELRRIAAM